MTNRIVILMPSVNKNAFRVDELLARQDFYCSKLREVQGKEFQKPIVLLSGARKQQLSFENIDVDIVSSKNISIFSFFLSSRKLIRKNNIRVLSYVAGTPFQPYLIALLLKHFCTKAKIHTAIHGEILGIKKSGLSGFVKYLFLKLFINGADTLRFVSDQQLKDALEFLPVSRIKTFVTPVPVLHAKVFERKFSPFTVGFVGRLQAERGIDDWIDIAKHFGDDNLILVGDGPMMKEVKKQLPRAKFLGALNNEQVQESWDKIGVLLSTAPFESYGLALREALLHGVPVVSRRNAGASELHAEYPTLIDLFDSNDEAVSKVREKQSGSYLKDEFERYRLEFFRKQEISLNILAQAWCNEL
jgi:glycosyltransferase involved in cell wall biosynthesis